MKKYNIVWDSDPSRIIEDLNEYIQNKANTEKILRNRIQELQDDAFKDNTISKLMQEINSLRLRTNYYLTEEEQKKLYEWEKKISESYPMKATVSVSPSITFIPTSIGMGITAEYMGNKLILRDID